MRFQSLHIYVCSRSQVDNGLPGPCSLLKLETEFGRQGGKLLDLVVIAVCSWCYIMQSTCFLTCTECRLCPSLFISSLTLSPWSYTSLLYKEWRNTARDNYRGSESLLFFLSIWPGLISHGKINSLHFQHPFPTYICLVNWFVYISRDISQVSVDFTSTT